MNNLITKNINKILSFDKNLAYINHVRFAIDPSYRSKLKSTVYSSDGNRVTVSTATRKMLKRKYLLTLHYNNFTDGSQFIKSTKFYEIYILLQIKYFNILINIKY